MQDLLNASLGLNLGVDFLPGSFGFDGDVPRPAAEDRGARCSGWTRFTANVDRSWRNPNLLVWHGDLWVDRPRRLRCTSTTAGAAASADPARFAAPALRRLRDHVLAAYAGGLPARRRRARRACSTRGVLAEVLAEVPDEWLEPVPGAETPDDAAGGVRRVPARPARRRRAVAAGGRACGMTDRLAYQYVVLRCVPRVDREEFVNVGVVLYCQAGRLPRRPPGTSTATGCCALRPGVDVDAVCRSLEFVEAASARGDARAGAAGAPSRSAQRFGFLKAPRAPSLQPGPVHGGITADPARRARPPARPRLVQ